MNWRRWNNILHRDVGYLLVGMTLVYSISGIAVNHRADWNPNYRQEKQLLSIDPISKTTSSEILADALAKLGVDKSAVRNSFRPDEETLQIFLEGKTFSIDLPTGTVLVEEVHRRPVLFELNQLHLNAPKGIWTFISDFFALSLILIAITGMFVLKGSNGILGRGIWFVAAGILVPVAYWVYFLNF
jgi:uncharacterized protein